MLACGITIARADDDDGHSHRHGYKHVLLISVDGMHAVDLKRWVESRPGGNFAKLSDNGLVYPNAYTTAPSDSYPGMLAQVGLMRSRRSSHDRSGKAKIYYIPSELTNGDLHG